MLNFKQDVSKHVTEIGGHVSVSGGVHLAVERAAAIGGNCMQVFSGSPRSWRRSELKKNDIKKMFANQQELSVYSIFTHALYLVNLASNNQELVDKSVRSLIFDLRFDSLVKGSGVVVHLGSHQGRGWDAVKHQLVDIIKRILQATPQDSMLLLENSAGQKGKIASDLKEIKWLLDQIKSKRVGWCVDTCHAFAAGYPLVGSSKYTQNSTKEDLVTVIEDLHLTDSLRCLHVNDSKTKFGSGNDRHANISEGLIPQSDLKQFLNNQSLIGIPIITEVPGLDDKGPDQENIERIKNLVDK